MADMSNPKDNVGKGGSGVQGPEDRLFQTLRMKSRAVRDGQELFTWQELNTIIAQLLLER